MAAKKVITMQAILTPSLTLSRTTTAHCVLPAAPRPPRAPPPPSLASPSEPCAAPTSSLTIDPSSNALLLLNYTLARQLPSRSAPPAA